MRRRRNIQHGQERRMPLSYRLPLVLIVLEIVALFAVIIFALPPTLDYFS